MMITVIAALLSTISVVKGFPNGSGGCEGGMAAVRGSHISEARPILNSFFSEAGLSLIVGNTTVTNEEIAQFPIDTPLTIVVESSTVPFRGALIRATRSDGLDPAGQLVADPTTLQNAAVCDALVNVTGVTHFSPEEKLFVGAAIIANEPVSMVLEITVVFQNSADASVFAYDQFVLSFDGEVTDPPAPTEPPATPVPVDSDPPSDMPSDMPSDAPIDVTEATLAEVAASLEGYDIFNEFFGLVRLEALLPENVTIVTVFAPNDDAFDAIGEETLDFLRVPANIAVLEAVLKNHIVAGSVPSQALDNGSIIEFVSGQTRPVTKTPTGEITIGDAMVVAPDNLAIDGIIHGINMVITFPEEVPTEAPVTAAPTTEPPVTPTPTEPPVTITEAPVPPGTDPPIAPTEAPVDAPIDVTEAPVPAPTEPPVTISEAPVPPGTDPPVAPPTNPPVAPPTEPPVAPPTEPPVAPTEPPVAPTEPPVAPTEPPVAPTEPPVAPTDPPVAPTEPPVGKKTKKAKTDKKLKKENKKLKKTKKVKTMKDKKTKTKKGKDKKEKKDKISKSSKKKDSTTKTKDDSSKKKTSKSEDRKE